ncbi:MAG: adhesin [Methanosphaera sp.]|nr:adhesin [Methanosphaera sp.]
MKEKISILLVIALILTSTVSATNVFLTSDSISNTDNDLDMLKSIKNYVEELSGGQITVTIDSQAPSPGEGTRLIESNYDVGVNVANPCAGNLLILAKYAVNSDKQIIYVNTGDFDLNNSDGYIRRAWDDDYSSNIFAGINNPGKYLQDAGIEYIQPLQEYPDAAYKGTYSQSRDEVNKYIAQQIVDKINNNNDNRAYDDGLVLTHKLDVSQMAKASKELYESEDSSYDDTYNGYTASQVLYLTASYLNGNGLESPSGYEAPSTPWTYSFFAKDAYTISDYMKMGGIVKQYMDENNKAPDYIEYNGAYIAYPDLVRTFAKITENHTDSSSMNFYGSYYLEKVNHSFIIDMLPIAALILVFIVALAILRRLLRFRRRR